MRGSRRVRRNRIPIPFELQSIIELRYDLRLVAKKTKKKRGSPSKPKPGRILEMLTARIEGAVGDLGRNH